MSPPSGPCSVSWFFSETLALYKSLTYLLTYFSVFGNVARMPDETDAKKILTASPWRTGGDHQDALLLSEWRLSSRTWNSLISPRMNRLMWFRFNCDKSILCTCTVCIVRCYALVVVCTRSEWVNVYSCQCCVGEFRNGIEISYSSSSQSWETAVYTRATAFLSVN